MAIGLKELGVAGLVAAGLIALAHLGVTEALGAHPFWAFKVGYVGVALGLIFYAVQTLVSLPWTLKSLAFAGLLGVSVAATVIGKARFAASYADDFIAGRMWFFGWMGIICFCFVLLVHLVAGRR
jgi:hypothetical protein